MTSEEKAELLAAIKEADLLLSHDEREWVRLAIKREAQSIKLREAIIEKTLSGLVWFFILGIGYVFLDFLRSRGLRL